MNLFSKLWGKHRQRRPIRPGLRFESLEGRSLLAADTLPVLMVIANDHDFYYKEYQDTRQSLESAGLDVQVAATTTNPSTPHWNSGQGWESDGVVVPDVALADVNPAEYSAIAFVGGWGSSMYQYAFEGTYANSHYNGDLATKEIVNNLINDFVADDKYVAAICHGTTVLAWARVDGVSPIQGKQVSVPYIGSPAVQYEGAWYADMQLGQYEQAVANGAVANTVSGQYGDPSTTADDVWVDGKIITAENWDSAHYFGQVIAEQVLAAGAGAEDPPLVGVYRAGEDVVVQASGDADLVYVWSGYAADEVFIWFNGQNYGSHQMAGGGRVIVFGGSGNDTIFATDARHPVEIHGEGGHDLIVGGQADDSLDGGDGVDRLMGGPGNDVIRGGAGDDMIGGEAGNDILLGGDGHDWIEGHEGRDLIFGGLGGDTLRGGGGEDLLIGGQTSYDNDNQALNAIRNAWLAPGSVADRANRFAIGIGLGVYFAWGETIHDDFDRDTLWGAGDADLLFSRLGDAVYAQLDDVLA